MKDAHNGEITRINGEELKLVTDLRAGEIVTFGRYQQSEDSSAGAEAIEWIVLDVEEKRALLFSRYVLDVVRYNEDTKRVPWKDCTLRKWLNKDFYQNAFTASEQSLIQKTALKNHDFIYLFNPVNSDTTDRIFPLSDAELYRYFDIPGENYAEATPYARQKGINSYLVSEEHYDKSLKDRDISRDVIGCSVPAWWIRSNSDGWKTVDSNFIVSTIGGGMPIAAKDIGVRPALYVSW